MTFTQRLKGHGGERLVNIWGESVLSREGKACAKALGQHMLGLLKEEQVWRQVRVSVEEREEVGVVQCETTWDIMAYCKAFDFYSG